MQDTNKKWDAMVNICPNAAKKVLGERPKSKNNRCENREIVKLSEKQKKMRGQIGSTRNRKLKPNKTKGRNKILKEIKEVMKKEKEKVIDKESEEVKSKHTNVSKCFEAVPLLKRKKPEKLIVYNGNGDIVNTEKQQTVEITDFFREILEKDNQGTLLAGWRSLSQKKRLVKHPRN